MVEGLGETGQRPVVVQGVHVQQDSQVAHVDVDRSAGARALREELLQVTPRVRGHQQLDESAGQQGRVSSAAQAGGINDVGIAGGETCEQQAQGAGCDERAVRGQDEEGMDIAGQGSRSGPDRGEHPRCVLRVVRPHRSQTLYHWGHPLGLMTCDDDHLGDADLAQPAHHPLKGGLRSKGEEGLEAAHAGRESGGQYDRRGAAGDGRAGFARGAHLSAIVAVTRARRLLVGCG